MFRIPRLPAPARMALILPVLLSAACATASPTVPAQRALYNDVLTLVRSQARDEWTLDRVALGNIAPGVAWSGCQTDAPTRRGLLAWLDAAISAEEARLGSSAAEHWRRHRDKGEVADLIELDRVRKAVADLHTRAEAECPFWLEADPAFVGTQGNAERFTIWLESRGGGSLNIRGDALALSGGGAGRALFGSGISDRLTLMAGLELGGAGRFDLEGKVSAVFGAAIPVVLRFVDAGQVFDIEVAATTFLDPDIGLPPAIRVALAYGFVTPRVGGAFSPMATFWVGWEYHPPRGDDPPFHMIGLGTRIGVDIDP
jgi:hypothetical protein